MKDRTLLVRAALLAGAIVGLGACSGSTSPAGTGHDAAASSTENAIGPAGNGGQCSWPQGLYDGGPGIRACTVGHAFLKCTYASGAACGAFAATGPLEQLCISDDPTACAHCGTDAGATCVNQCGANEYAVSCGGPPAFSEDGAVPFVYQDVPDGCAPAGVTPGGNQYACCPCQ